MAPAFLALLLVAACSSRRAHPKAPPTSLAPGRSAFLIARGRGGVGGGHRSLPTRPGARCGGCGCVGGGGGRGGVTPEEEAWSLLLLRLDAAGSSRRSSRRRASYAAAGRRGMFGTTTRRRPSFLSASAASSESSSAAVEGNAVGTNNRTRASGLRRSGGAPNDGASSTSANSSTTADDDTASAALGYRVLYPPSTAHRNGTLKVDDVHTLYYEVHGRKTPGEEDDGKPLADSTRRRRRTPPKTALFLHGGPGAGCFPNHARFFDPDVYRIVLFDQRGSGKSVPRGEIRNNTLSLLVDDCEALRAALEIDAWDVVLGGSWGSTLALSYAQTFPERVRSMVLRGVCLMRPEEINWLFGSDGGAARADPDGWRAFERAAGIDDDGDGGNGDDPRAALHAYYDRLLGDDPVERFQAAKSWFRWEMGVLASNRGNNATRPVGNAAGAHAAHAEDGATPSTSTTVLVWERESGWSYRDPRGEKLVSADAVGANGAASPAREDDDASMRETIAGLRKWSSPAPPQSQTSANAPETAVLEMRPRPVKTPTTVDSTQAASEGSPPNVSVAELKNFVPAQAMLTCFYSANGEVLIDGGSLLSEERMGRIRHIPCVAVQGGRDDVCPPDAALDLLDAWPEMELWVPLDAGHSMYDPAVTNEIIGATDSVAAESTRK